MFEHITYESLLRQMLSAVREKNPDIDTREGSPVWYGLAPAAVELQSMYIQLDAVLNETFADTASRPYLIKRAAERGITPRPATRMLGRGDFTPAGLEVTTGARFSLGILNYTVIEKIRAGVYRLECETAGERGNEQLGTLIPVEYIPGLETARLTGILIPGEDEESTESVRKRYFDSLSAQSYGGNVADYREKVNAIPGVGGVKVYRAWNGGIRPAALVPPETLDAWLAGLGDTPPEAGAWLMTISKAARDGLITVGGTIRLVIIDSTFSEPSGELVETVQNIIDPADSHAEGLGVAPIGHFVTVEGVRTTHVDVSAHITYQGGWLWDDVRPYAEKALDEYFKELAAGWVDSDAPLVVRISQIETRFLSCPGVLDITGTTINGAGFNLELGANEVPVRGEVNG